jgi:hypothetical protein
MAGVLQIGALLSGGARAEYEVRRNITVVILIILIILAAPAHTLCIHARSHTASSSTLMPLARARATEPRQPVML